ncbi:hypothetical protein [Haloarchaeobius sp. DFWS5]|uniref:hypothetical protein n=1 Tax=Haloarchaeobius sp. DFWS5 TaxID=3446114 RepID=UPI003EBEA28D
MSVQRPITVGVTPRRDLAFQSTIAGLLSGIALLVVATQTTFGATALGTSMELSTETPDLFLWHLLFAGLFGGFFGVLVHSRPLWRYGRGFLGPVVGAVFGLCSWAVVAAVLEPLWLIGHGIAPLSAVPTVSVPVLLTYVTFGAVVGFVSNLWF